MTISLKYINYSKSLAVFAFIIFSLIVFYIFQFVSLNSKTFAISNIQKNILKLSQENKQIEVQIANNSIIPQLEKLAKESNFEKISNINYIKIGPKSVAKR